MWHELFNWKHNFLEILIFFEDIGQRDFWVQLQTSITDVAMTILFRSIDLVSSIISNGLRRYQKIGGGGLHQDTNKALIINRIVKETSVPTKFYFEFFIYLVFLFNYYFLYFIWKKKIICLLNPLRIIERIRKM